MDDRKKLEKFLEFAVIRAGTPGAVAYIGRGNEVLFHAGYGRYADEQSEVVTEETIYDLASLTKVIATTTSIMLLYQKKRIHLDDSIAQYIPIQKFKGITLRHLLSHSSGLIGYAPWYSDVFSMEDIIIRLSKTDLQFPPGTRHLYSDFGFMLLGHIVESVSYQTLDEFCAQHIFKPLGMYTTYFRIPDELKCKCAPTEICSWRNRLIRGEVHDENAYAVGGVAGHAGLFSTAKDLAKFCRAMIGRMLLSDEITEEMTSCRVIRDYPWQVLGWKTDPFWESIEGQLPFRSAVGHTGFTGTCMWWDRCTGYYAILLSNTCYPNRQKRDNRTLRKTFFNSLALLIAPKKINTHLGIDVLLRENYLNVKNARVALMTNTSASTSFGVPTMDILRESPRVQLKWLIALEHGLQVREEAGKGESARSWYGIPIIDAYCDVSDEVWRKLMREVDYLVVDIPDVGARYYTYIYSMWKVMKRCAKYKKPMLILDRPNPLGGAIIEGILPDKKYIQEVCWGRVPNRHGVTVGEAGVFLKHNDPELSDLKLEIVQLDGGFNDLLFSEIDLRWIPPSPNMVSLDTALCYVGTCLFEGTNVSEGRGTDTPFRVVGAPWCEPEKIIENISESSKKGAELRVCPFVPVSIAGKVSQPKYENQQCWGIQIEVIDQKEFRPFTLAIDLLIQFRRVHPEVFRFTSFFDKLAGTSRLRKMIEFGEDVWGWLNSTEVQGEIDEYKRKRPHFYPSFVTEREKLFSGRM